MWIIKPGYFEKKQSGKRQPGLDLSRAVGDWLRSVGIIASKDCCTYYPSFPFVELSDPSSGPTEQELKNIPVWGMFRTQTATDWYIFVKTSETTWYTISNGTFV